MNTDLGKSTLPPYSAVANPPAWRRGSLIRRSRGLRLFALACLAFIVYAQWRQMPSPASVDVGSSLSIKKLQEDLATCAKLRTKPQDPVGPGRERNARYIDGHQPTLIRNATVWTGEAAAGTSKTDARAGKGFSWTAADVLLQHGLIARVAAPGSISLSSLPKDILVYDARGRQLTAGIVDVHSHAGVESLPMLQGNEDTNEGSADITPYVRSIDGINPLDYQIQVIKSGGVTTSLVLPGSSNNIGGEAYAIKHAVGKADGRNETGAWSMLADPDRSWRYMKMACGENPKRVYGRFGMQGPVSRMGESWEFRRAFEQAAKLVREQDDWCDAASAKGVEKMSSYLPQELKWESLAAVLRGQVHVNTHCYTIPDVEAFVDHTNEFKFAVRAFHHAHQTFLVPEILKRAWGGRPPASALFADNMWYKAESNVASEYAGKILWDEGLTPIYVSDNPVINAQHVVFEAAKAYGYGLPYHVALAAVTTAPAELLGLGQRIGKVKEGFDADVVVWDSDPLSVGATPLQVWIDGDAQFEHPVQLDKPFSHPIVPDEVLSFIPSEPVDLENVIFTGITKVLLPDHDILSSATAPVNLVITAGEITCIGSCTTDLATAASSPTKILALRNGHLTSAFTAFGSAIGLNAIDMEFTTDNGRDGNVFSRAADGLALETNKLRAAHRYGATRAVSAPKSVGLLSNHHGTSAAFLTGARTTAEVGALLIEDVAVHYTLDLTSKDGKTPSISAAVGELRRKLFRAAQANANSTVSADDRGDGGSDPYSEQAYLRKVVEGRLPLVVTVHSADTIAAVLRVKEQVEATAASALPNSVAPPKIRLVIFGGAESYLVASALAAADVGVVLAPFRSYATTWDQRRALPGAPLANGTAAEALLDAGVRIAIGLEEDWIVHDLRLLAGIAYANGGGRLSEQEALALVGENLWEMLGRVEEDAGGTGEAKRSHFLVFEGSPLEIGGRIKAVAGGLGKVSVFE